MKKYKKLVALGLTVVLGMCTALTGCGKDSEQTSGGNTSGSTESDEKVTVKILQFKTELSEQMNEMAEEYMKEHPDVNLEVESIISSNYDTVLKTRFASNEAPDIFNNEGYEKMNLWMDHLEDLSDQSWVDDMLDLTKEGISSEGGVYGLPLYLEGYGFLYNKDYFKEAGITEVPTTISELEEAIEKLEAAGIPAFSVNGAEYYPNGLFLSNVPMAQQENPDEFMRGINEGTETFVDNERYQEWIDLITLMRDHAVTDPLSVDFGTVVSDFASGKAAMIMGLNGYQPTIDEIDPDLNVGIMPMPINDDSEMNDKVYVSASTYWCVNKNSDDASKAAAKEFLEWLVTSETGQRYVTEVFGFIPGLSTIEADEEAVGAIGAEILEYVKEDKVAAWEWTKYPDGVTTEFGGTVQKFYAGELDGNGVLESFLDVWNELKED